MRSSEIRRFPATGAAVLACILAAAPAAAKEARGRAKAEKTDKPFPVLIKNDCDRAMEVRFVLVPPGLGKKRALALYEAAPVTVLPPHSAQTRSMRPHEQLVVLRERHSYGTAGFDEVLVGASLILSGETCNAISSEAEPKAQRS
ncbi:MAG: hypothetical protein KA712_20860 [Myxococcales bacterium]|nr:hypothetical protein [Myxococcales bacterium]